MAGSAVMLVLLFALVCGAHARAVNLSSVWLLPEEGYPVFYRYFRDRITWYEAEAVCQFHHGQLLTVDSGTQFDAARAYLKELDVAHFVWTGLRRAGPNDKFLWPENKGMEHEGYWQQEIPKTNDAVCAAIDPSSYFRWQPLPCSGPQAAAFICQMEVPSWAVQGCMVSSLPSLTVTFLPEEGAVELVSDCGYEGTRRIACKGHSNQEEIVKQLRCESTTEATVSSSQGTSWEDQPTRHRRESQVTPDMEHALPTTSPHPSRHVSDEVLTSEPTTELISVATSSSKTTKVSETTTEKGVNKTPGPTGSTTAGKESKLGIGVPDSETVMPTTEADRKQMLSDLQVHKAELAIEREEAKKAVRLNRVGPGALVPLEGAALASDGQPPKRTVLVSSKPIPPSLGGNSPFLERVVDNSTEEEPEKDSHESFNESPSEVSPPRGTGTPAPVSVSRTMEDSGEVHETNGTEAEQPERPNRGRLLVHPQHHSFYPYFLNRVLG